MRLSGIFAAVILAFIFYTPLPALSSELGRYEGPISVDTTSSQFLESIQGLENPEGLIQAIRSLQAEQAVPSGSTTQASGSVSCTGGSGGWSCTGTLSWVFGTGGTASAFALVRPAPMDPPPTFPEPNIPRVSSGVNPAQVVISAQSVYESHPQSKAAPEILMGLGIFNGACWVSLGATRQCFDNFTEDMCHSLGQSTGGIVTHVPFGKCP